MLPAARRQHAYALFGYAVVAIVFTWPLAAQIGTSLTGDPAGDTGVYVWNQWVFQREVLERGNFPYFTDRIFSLTGRANLSLHNYTAFQDVVALPLGPWLGTIPAFNLVFLLMTVLTGYTTFLLARQVTGRSAEAWLAGLLFAWSPVLTTRGLSHFSLVAAAPLAVFMLLLLRTNQRMRDAVALGAVVCWAATADAYYPVYCVLLALLYVAARSVAIQPHAASRRSRVVPWTLDLLLFCVAGLVISMIISGGWQFTIRGRVAGVRSFYTPVLVFTLLATIRLAWRYRATRVQLNAPVFMRFLRFGVVGACSAALFMSPVLYAVGVRVAEQRWDSSDPVFWRSSPRGVDLLSFFLPNPNHPLSPESLRQWLSPRPDAYFENVASLTFVALGTLLVAWRAGWKIPRLWAGLAVVFGALALGPFIHVLGMNTHVPGPWALLRYVPVIGMARTPARFSIVLMLVLAVLFAVALRFIGDRWPAHRRRALLAVGALLVLELLSAPRTLYSAIIPPLYQTIAADPSDRRVLELPWGIRDGTRSIGNFTARSQFHQTVHGKPLVGGYLSRVSRRRILESQQRPMLAGLIRLSEGKRLDPETHATLVADGPSFVDRSEIGWVVVDRLRTPEPLREFAHRAYGLRFVEANGPLELYRPTGAAPRPPKTAGGDDSLTRTPDGTPPAFDR
jgi:hypothetical protein